MRALLGGVVLFLLGTACQKGSSGGPAGDLHASPEAAARCQLAAFKAKSVEAFLECVHPDLRAEFRAEFEDEERKDPQFWADGVEKLAALEKVKAIDFTLEPMPAGKESFGDQLASYRFSKYGKIELVRKDGKWYVVDPD